MMVKCKALTKEGKKCRAPAVGGGHFCLFHSKSTSGATRMYTRKKRYGRK